MTSWSGRFSGPNGDRTASSCFLGEDTAADGGGVAELRHGSLRTESQLQLHLFSILFLLCACLWWVGSGLWRALHDRRTVKNIPKYAPAQFYIDNVLPQITEKKIMALKPFVDDLGKLWKFYRSLNQQAEVQGELSCPEVFPEIEQMADVSVMALHLRFEKGMVGLSFCDFVGTREEKALMALYRQKEWPRRYKNGSHLWSLALQKRKEGRCPLEPGEVAVILRAMGYPKETQIYVASGQVLVDRTHGTTQEHVPKSCKAFCLIFHAIPLCQLD
ncbi:hypothetical protein C3L33_07671, partial [Rhododendron williamsianum]